MTILSYMMFINEQSKGGLKINNHVFRATTHSSSMQMTLHPRALSLPSAYWYIQYKNSNVLYTTHEYLHIHTINMPLIAQYIQAAIVLCVHTDHKHLGPLCRYQYNHCQAQNRNTKSPGRANQPICNRLWDLKKLEI